MQKKALLRASIAAALLVAGESFFVQANNNSNAVQERNRKRTMCFSKTKEEEGTETSTAQGQELRQDKADFKVQTWNPFRLAVLRLGLTEFPATSPFNYGKYNGQFTCAYCGNALFDSNSKYDSKSGWPSFWRSIQGSSISYKKELDGRLECRCGTCQSHLGHVFMDGPTPSSVDRPLLESSPETDPRTNSNRYLPRFCINGAAMKFQERED